MIDIVHMGRVPTGVVGRFLFEERVEKAAKKYKMILGEDFYKELLLYDEVVIYFENHKKIPKWHVQPYKEDKRGIVLSMISQIRL